MDRGQVTQPRVEYRVEYQVEYQFISEVFFSIKVELLLESGFKSLYIC